MRRISTIASIAVLSLSIATPLSFAGIKSGNVCKKLGITTIDGSRKYTCIKQGKKLVWDKGILVKAVPTKFPAPTPTASVTPNAAPIPGATPIPTASPTPTFTAPARPKSFGDLLENIDGISYWAWATSAEKIKNSSETSIEVEILFGPNTTKITHNTNLAVQNVSKLYSGAISPKKIVAIYYSYEDREWGQSTFEKYSLRPKGDETKNMCQTAITCWGGMAEIDYRGIGILLMSVNETTKIDKQHTSGPLQAHEFAHTFQATQFVGTTKEFNSYCCIKHYLPWWTVEGGATFAETVAINFDSFDGYKIYMSKSYNDFLFSSEGPYTKEWFEKFLQPSSPLMWGEKQYQWKIYSGGAMVEEIFVSLKGPDISMNLIRDVAIGFSWAEAFEKNFGISWSSAVPIIAEILAKKVLNN